MGLQEPFVSYKCYIDGNALLSNVYVPNLRESLDFLFEGGAPKITTPRQIKLNFWIYSSLRRVFKMQNGCKEDMAYSF